jgi:DNA polymerase III gamma/tau subunit
LTKTEEDIRNSAHPRFQLEIGLVRLAQARRLFLLEEALDRIASLESKLGGGGLAASSLPAAGPIAQKTSRTSQPTRSTATRSAAPSVRPRESESTAGKHEARGQSATLSEAAASLPRGGFGRATGDLSKSSAEAAAPVEPPRFDDLYEAAPAPESKAAARADRTPIDRIKDELESKGRMRVAAALDKGTISIDGDHLCVAYSPENAASKSEIEDRNRRMLIEDACEQVVGRRLTLKVSITGEAVSGDEPAGQRGSQRRAKAKAAEEDPKLQALLDTFHGEVIEVIKPER